MSYVSRQDWIDCALRALIEQGPEFISASKLASALGVTRGSFYHHFNKVEDLYQELLKHWEEETTTKALRTYQESDKPLDKTVDTLLQFAWTRDPRLEIAIRAWATSNRQVADFVAIVDKKRLEMLADVYSRLTGSPEKGSSMSKIALYGLIGALHAQPKMSQTQLQKLIMEIHTLMVGSL